MSVWLYVNKSKPFWCRRFLNSWTVSATLLDCVVWKHGFRNGWDCRNTNWAHWRKYKSTSSGFRGADAFSLQGFDPRPTQRIPSPLVLLWDIHFWLTDPKNWHKHILILRGSSRRKNAIFCSTFSKKVPKTPFLPVCSKVWLRCKNFCQN